MGGPDMLVALLSTYASDDLIRSLLCFAPMLQTTRYVCCNAKFPGKGRDGDVLTLEHTGPAPSGADTQRWQVLFSHDPFVLIIPFIFIHSY